MTRQEIGEGENAVAEVIKTDARVEAFQAELVKLYRMLNDGQITDRQFFEGLMSAGDGKSLSAFVMVDQGQGYETYDLERTRFGIRLEHSDKSTITALIGLDKKGKLGVKSVHERWFDEGEMHWDEGLSYKEKKDWGEYFLQGFLHHLAPQYIQYYQQK